ncbi:HAMP domain-containing protein [Lachnospiraceae bacterium RM5]|nr:HAMP domain-containing protein [Lachnospiraceae bacterium RM5]
MENILRQYGDLDISLKSHKCGIFRIGDVILKLRNSIRFKITLMLCSFTLISFAVFIIINSIFLPRFYIKEKEKTLLNCYEKISESLADSEKISEDDEESLSKLCEKHGITIVIIDNSGSEIFRYGNGTVLVQRLLEINLGLNSENYSIIEKNNNYTLSRYLLNKNDESGFLELNGFFSDNKIFLMRIAINSIRESADISNRFFVYIAIIVFTIEIFGSLIFTRIFTKPIKHLARVSEEMAHLNFKEKSMIKTNDEIGILGNNLNYMSDELEKTLSELQSANEMLKKDIEKKEEIDNMRKEFISNISHELKTPIALIQGYAEGLSDSVVDDEESKQFYCDVIEDEAMKMNKMVKNLLALNQLEIGAVELEMEDFSINEVIKGIVGKLSYLAKEKDVNIEFIEDKNYFVRADEFKIEEVITNYLTNAINYVENKGWIKVWLDFINEDVVRLNVYNSGSNIPEEDIENIWTKFYKVDKARTREYGGSGIGLSIVKAIATNHKTECGVENVDDGVKFFFDLKVVNYDSNN